MKSFLILALATIACVKADNVFLTINSAGPTTPGGLHTWSFSLFNDTPGYLIVNEATLDPGSFTGVVQLLGFTEQIASNFTYVNPGATATGTFGTAAIDPLAPLGAHSGTFKLGYDLYVNDVVNGGASDLGDQFGLFLNNVPASIQVNSPTAVPEPSTALLWVGGLGALALYRRHNARQIREQRRN